MKLAPGLKTGYWQNIIDRWRSYLWLNNITTLNMAHLPRCIKFFFHQLTESISITAEVNYLEKDKKGIIINWLKTISNKPNSLTLMYHVSTNWKLIETCSISNKLNSAMYHLSNNWNLFNKTLHQSMYYKFNAKNRSTHKLATTVGLNASMLVLRLIFVKGKILINNLACKFWILWQIVYLFMLMNDNFWHIM